MLDGYRTEKSFCSFPAFTYWQLHGKPVSSYFYDKLKLHFVNKLRSKTPCLACEHSGGDHLHTNRDNDGYAECKVAGCKCGWFSPDSEVWESL